MSPEAARFSVPKFPLQYSGSRLADDLLSPMPDLPLPFIIVRVKHTQ